MPLGVVRITPLTILTMKLRAIPMVNTVTATVVATIMVILPLAVRIRWIQELWMDPYNAAKVILARMVLAVTKMANGACRVVLGLVTKADN